MRPRRVRDPAGARNRKKMTPQIIFKNPRSRIKPESAPDPNKDYKTNMYNFKMCTTIVSIQYLY